MQTLACPIESECCTHYQLGRVTGVRIGSRSSSAGYNREHGTRDIADEYHQIGHRANIALVYGGLKALVESIEIPKLCVLENVCSVHGMVDCVWPLLTVQSYGIHCFVSCL